MDLQEEFERAKKTDSFKVHNGFLNKLLESNDLNHLDFQYKVMQDPTNKDLQRIVGKGFVKRATIGLTYLVHKLEIEDDDNKKANIIHTIGLFKDRTIIDRIIPFLNNKNTEIRYKTIVVLGWIGDGSTVDLFGVQINIEKEGYLRGFIATAMRQIYYRLPNVKEEVLNILYSKLPVESNAEAIALYIAVIQNLTLQKFGIKEDAQTGEISGDILKAKEKVIKTLKKI